MSRNTLDLPDTRVLFGRAARAWIKDKSNRFRRATRIDAQAAINSGRWGLVVGRETVGWNPAGIGDKATMTPIYREVAYAVQCKVCGHRLRPNMVAARITHMRKHGPQIPDEPVTPDMV